MFYKTFKNKKVLITGHTGFKGSWLSIWMYLLGAKVVGISLYIPSIPSNYKVSKIGKFIKSYNADITNYKKISKIILKENPDFVFHLAAQAIVSKSFHQSLITYNTNILGTINILETLKKIKKKCVGVIITSDKCYYNKEREFGYKETDRLGGDDPYSASKASAEIIFKAYYKSFFSHKGSNIRIGSARAGNVIGGGDWANDRLIPDCIRAWQNSKKVVLRNPHSTRPWQHVLEPLSGYITFAINLYNSKKLSGESFNFGPPDENNYTSLQLVTKMSKHWNNVKWDIKKNKTFNESKLLKLNCEKAKLILKWKPKLNFDDTVYYTADWYKFFYTNKMKILEKTISQINFYIKA